MAQSPENTPPQSPDANVSVSRRQVALTWLAVLAAIAVFVWKKPDTAVTVVTFIVVLSVLVFVHEWGHFQFARWAGMKVNRFAIGFPPFIYTKRVKGIDYSIGALPIGGMVDIAGLGSEEEMVATTKGEPLQVAAPRLNAPRGQKMFQDGSLGWRFMTLFAGPMMNFIYALVIFIGVFTFIGLPDPIPTGAIESVPAGTPASVAGLLPQDKIIGVDKLRTSDPLEISQAVRAKKGAAVTLLIQRDGETIRKQITPIIKDVDGNGKAVPYLGVQFDPNGVDLKYKKTDVVTAVKEGFIRSAGISLQILDTLKRAATRSLSKEEVKGIGGPVKIAQATGEFSKKGPVALLLLSAMLSVNLGLMNLLPFPALDGGRILFLGYELIARKPIDARKEGIAHTVGMVMLLAFMLFITARDILPFITKQFS